MKLLIITQNVDRNDPILGFFHRWLAEFAKHAEVTVIGQSVGEYDLPGVRVESLGKEKGLSRVMQIIRFWRLIMAHRKDYDAVFVHMTPIWIVLGAKAWFLLRKPMYLWYEARGGGIWLRFALLVCRRSFSASSHGLPVSSSKNLIVGHGIDTAFFRPSLHEREDDLLVTVGRVAASKRLEMLIDTLLELPDTIRLQIAGLPLTEPDKGYAQHLDAEIHNNGLKKRIHRGALRQDQIVPLLQSATVFLHASETALDKALLEAMACACPVVSCASAVQDILPEVCQSTPATFAIQVQAMIERSAAQRDAIGKDLRMIVERNHGLTMLIERLVQTMSLR